MRHGLVARVPPSIFRRLYSPVMAITVRTGNAGDMQSVLPLLFRQMQERAAVDPGFFALRRDAAARFQKWLGPAMEDPRTSWSSRKPTAAPPWDT